MDSIENIIYRLSPSQLRALNLLAKSKKGIVSSSSSSKDIGKQGKALGGVFSAISRRNFGSEKLILPWGKSFDGRGLNWRLNEKVITKEKLAKITTEILSI